MKNREAEDTLGFAVAMRVLGLKIANQEAAADCGRRWGESLESERNDWRDKFWTEEKERAALRAKFERYQVDMAATVEDRDNTIAIMCRGTEADRIDAEERRANLEKHFGAEVKRLQDLLADRDQAVETLVKEREALASANATLLSQVECLEDAGQAVSNKFERLWSRIESIRAIATGKPSEYRPDNLAKLRRIVEICLYGAPTTEDTAQEVPHAEG